MSTHPLPPNAPWVETVMIMLRIMRLIFLIRSYPASSWQHVYRASVSTCRASFPSTPPLSVRPSPPRAPCSRSARTGIPLYLLIDWSVGQSDLVAPPLVLVAISGLKCLLFLPVRLIKRGESRFGVWNDILTYIWPLSTWVLVDMASQFLLLLCTPTTIYFCVGIVTTLLMP